MNPYVMNLRDMIQSKRAREEQVSKIKGMEENGQQQGLTLDQQLEKLCSKFNLDR